MTLPTLNVDLLTDLVKWAGKDEADLDKFFADKGWPEWDQTNWAKIVRNGICQTSCCMAGNAVLQSGYLLVYSEDFPTDEWDEGDETFREWSVNQCAPRIPSGTDDKGNPVYVYDDEEVASIGSTARELLGLTHREADLLFNGDNGVGDVVVIAQAIALRRNLTLDLPDALLNLPTTKFVTQDALPLGRDGESADNLASYIDQYEWA